MGIVAGAVPSSKQAAAPSGLNSGWAVGRAFEGIALRLLFLTAEPVGESERQEMADIDDLSRLAFDDRRADT